ncbi:Putative transposase (identified by ISEscan HMM) [Escherichia coli]|nr:Putative transposase (identified by ISEscan HMM) [Escherichia coli]
MKASGKSKAWPERRRIWRKQTGADSNTHEIICADLSLNNVTDQKPSRSYPADHRKSGQHRQTALTTPGSVTMNCGVRKSARLSHPEKVRVTGLVNMQTVTVQANQRMTGSNARWKWTTDYNRRSIAKRRCTGKTAVRGSLTLRDYDGQVEAMAPYER